MARRDKNDPFPTYQRWLWCQKKDAYGENEIIHILKYDGGLFMLLGSCYTGTCTQQ